MWGQSFAFRALVDSLIAEKADGTVLIGRGVPVEWTGQPIEVANVPVARGKRMGFVIGGTTTDVTLALTGDVPLGNVEFELPAFQGRICSASAGEVHRDEGYVELPAGMTDVMVHLGDECVGTDAGVDGGNPGARGSNIGAPDGASCGCRAAGIGGEGGFKSIAPMALALLAARRRRRQRSVREIVNSV